MDTEKLAHRLTSWIKEQVAAARCQGIVLGISGGLDSSVLAVLCKRALPENVLGIMMPCYSSPEDEEHARILAEKFSIPTRLVVLDSVFDTLLQLASAADSNPETHLLAEANLKVRLRMVTLYYFANRLQYMVAGSSNRSELTIGYFTKYGDGGVDIMPLGNLVKEQVIKLARFLDIPEEIIVKPPSAGLWPGQTDENEMGISYKELDDYIVSGEASPEVRETIETMISGARHKRRLPLIAMPQD